MNSAKFWLVRVVSCVLVFAFAFGVHSFLGGLPNEFPYRLAVLGGLYVTLAVSLNLINGITGQFSVGHAAFYMVGAYTTGMLAKLYMMPFLNATHLGDNDTGRAVWLIGVMIVSALVAAAFGFLVGLPSLRLKGDYLAIVTLGFGEILRILGENLNIHVGDQDIVAGAYGIPSVPKLFDLWLVLLLASFSIAICRNLLKTAHGLPFLAVREDEVASSAMGVNVTQIKVTAFVIGASLAGAAGALLMHYETYVSPASFKMEVSFLILTMVVLGGTGSITGSTVGALLLFGVPEYLRTIQDSHGAAVHVTAGMVSGWVVAVVLATFLVKRVVEKFHGGIAKKRGLVLLTIGGAVLVAPLLGVLLDLMPAFHEKTWTFTDLRWAIVAGVLIIIMLLRPQGMFAHREISLDRIFGRKPLGVWS